MAKDYILVVEDERDILELVTYTLTKEGYRVDGASTGEEALVGIAAHPPNLVVLDLMLPGIDGFEICRRLKGGKETRHIPIVMMTARGEEADVVTGLELGADDYIVKPFSPKVLVARVRAVMRRGAEPAVDESAPIRIHDIVIHPGRFEVFVGGERIELTSTEFRLLTHLARRPGWVFTRYQIVDALHGDEYPVTDRSVDVQVVGLRKKLGKAGACIETVRGVGYRFKD